MSSSVPLGLAGAVPKHLKMDHKGTYNLDYSSANERIDLTALNADGGYVQFIANNPFSPAYIAAAHALSAASYDLNMVKEMNAMYRKCVVINSETLCTFKHDGNVSVLTNLICGVTAVTKTQLADVSNSAISDCLLANFYGTVLVPLATGQSRTLVNSVVPHKLLGLVDPITNEDLHCVGNVAPVEPVYWIYWVAKGNNYLLDAGRVNVWIQLRETVVWFEPTNYQRTTTAGNS